ncbi:hypothetical protein A3Q56_06157 [Intoshia linei]|uniref:Uncharacterized protein n=1 Tax=Intoshia linei TaxID=1819745 RepID=A0A177AVS0_9BILA|nr:hypothetical protein A3Q56_06157 [Intoshia linei]
MPGNTIPNSQKELIVNKTLEGLSITSISRILSIPRTSVSNIVHKFLRILKNFHYNLKALVLVPVGRNCERTIISRCEYAWMFRELMMSTSQKNIIFLDYVGFSVVTRPKKGRSRIGIYPYLGVAAARSI